MVHGEIADILGSEVCDFAEAAVELKLPLSSKAVICASKFMVAINLTAELNKQGIKFIAARRTRDLGITHSAAASRPKQQLKTGA